MSPVWLVWHQATWPLVPRPIIGAPATVSPIMCMSPPPSTWVSRCVWYRNAGEVSARWPSPATMELPLADSSGPTAHELEPQGSPGIRPNRARSIRSPSATARASTPASTFGPERSTGVGSPNERASGETKPPLLSTG